MLFQEERERHKHNNEKDREGEDAFQVFLDHAVIGVEFGSHCRDVCNGSGSFIFLGHFILLIL